MNTEYITFYIYEQCYQRCVLSDNSDRFPIPMFHKPKSLRYVTRAEKCFKYIFKLYTTVYSLKKPVVEQKTKAKKKLSQTS